jgi:Superinfection immunity protein
MIENTQHASTDIIQGWIGLALVACLYFLPSIIAGMRGHQNTGPIFVINAFLGWTFILWVVCVAWALTEISIQQRELNERRRRQDSYQPKPEAWWTTREKWFGGAGGGSPGANTTTTKKE